MPPYKRRFVKKRSYRSRSSSKYRRPTLLKRLRTRAYANLRTGGLLAIERKFSDWSHPETALTTPGAGVASGAASTYAPAIVGPTVYRSAVGTITRCTGAPAAAAPIALNVLGPGDTGSDRDGRQVINDSIHLRGVVSYNTTDFATSDGSTCINLVLVLDTQTNGAGPASGGAIFVNPGDLETAATGTAIANGASPFVNLSNSKRFRILKHIRRQLQPSAVSGNGTVSYASGGFCWAMDVPLKQMKTNYVADTAVPGATVSSIGDNGIFFLAWCDIGNSFTVMSYNSRLRFRG